MRFFMAREATGAQEDVWSKPRRRIEERLRPDLSLTIQITCRFSPTVVSHHHLLLSSGGVGSVLFRQEHSLQPRRSHTHRFARDAL